MGGLEKKGVLQSIDHLELLIIIIKIRVICTRMVFFLSDLIELKSHKTFSHKLNSNTSEKSGKGSNSTYARKRNIAFQSFFPICYHV